MPTSCADTLIVIPVLRRPHNVAPLLASIDAATPEPHRVLFMATGGDAEEIGAIRQAGAEWVEIAPNPVGDYQRKINIAYRSSSEPFIFTGADDLRFHDGWLSRALERMDDPAIGVVGTNDLGNARVLAGDHATHCLVRRSYADEYGTIDEPGLIFHEGYWHEFCDDELVGTAKARGAWVFAADSIVEHMHPLWGKASMDAIYNEQRARMRRSRPLFMQRRQLWEALVCP